MGSLGDKIPSDVVTVSKPLQSVQKKEVVKTFKTTEEERIYPEQPFDANSKQLKFRIPPKVDRAVKPADMYIQLPFTLKKADGKTNFAKPNDFSKDSIHARVINPFHANIIRKIAVKPNRNTDIEDGDVEKLQFLEKMRWVLQNNKAEKKHTEAAYDLGAFRDLYEGYNNEMVSPNGNMYQQTWTGYRTSDDRRFMATNAAYEALTLEELTHDRYHTFRIPLATAWNEVDSYMPGMWEFYIVIDLEKDELVTLQRATHELGEGDFNPSAANKPKLLLDTENTCLVVKYVELEDEDKTRFKNAFYGFKDLDFECFHGLNMVKSLPFEDGGPKAMTLKQDWDVLQGVVPRKFWFGFMLEKDFLFEENRTMERFGCFPFNIETVDILLNNKSIFRSQPLQFENNLTNQLYMHRLQSDSTAAEFDYANRYNPFTPHCFYCPRGKWIAYVDMHDEPGTRFSDMTERMNGDFKVVLTFKHQTDASKRNQLVMVIFWQEMPILTLKDGVSNQWQKRSTYATPIVVPPSETKNIRDGKH